MMGRRRIILGPPMLFKSQTSVPRLSATHGSWPTCCETFSAEWGSGKFLPWPQETDQVQDFSVSKRQALVTFDIFRGHFPAPGLPESQSAKSFHVSNSVGNYVGK